MCIRDRPMVVLHVLVEAGPLLVLLVVPSRDPFVPGHLGGSVFGKIVLLFVVFHLLASPPLQVFHLLVDQGGDVVRFLRSWYGDGSTPFLLLLLLLYILVQLTVRFLLSRSPGSTHRALLGQLIRVSNIR